MNRRDFIKVTARGSAFAIASPMLLDLLAGGGASAAGLAGLDDPGMADSMSRVLKAALANGGWWGQAHTRLEDGLRLL